MAVIQIGLTLEQIKQIGYILEDLEDNYISNMCLHDLVLIDFLDNYRDQAFNGLSNIISFNHSVVKAFQEKFLKDKKLEVLKIFEKCNA